MYVYRAAPKRKVPVIITKAEDEDFKLLTKKRFSFSWKSFKETTTVYKLHTITSDEILGVMGIIDIPAEDRVEIKLLSSSVENIGADKEYDGIAGCLIAFACRFALTQYGENACVSLVPKTKLRAHYMSKYRMKDAGLQLYIDGMNLISILNDYGY